jgi:uncharacterized Ntn-hydrolase superfamily protein
MTWSIVAHDARSGALGVIVATHTLGVGARCPFVRRGVGAVSTQSITNRALGSQLLDLLGGGHSASNAMAAVLGRDDGRDLRQLHAIDGHGNVAAWTGRHCVESCGHLAGPGISVAGNMLRSDQVLSATLSAFLARDDLEFSVRLLAAMEAGQTQGGDRRGARSAAILVAIDANYPEIDLRIDGHEQPLAALRDLAQRWRAEQTRDAPFAPQTSPAGLADMDRFEAMWRAQGLDIAFRR